MLGRRSLTAILFCSLASLLGACMEGSGENVDQPIFEDDPEPPTTNKKAGTLKPAPPGSGTPSTSRAKSAPLSDGGTSSPPPPANPGPTPPKTPASPNGEEMPPPAQTPQQGEEMAKETCVGFTGREIEPNDTIDKATILGDELCAIINSATDVDHIIFDSNDAQATQSFVFFPDRDARITVTAPSGEVRSTQQGAATYVSFEKGRFSIRINSPAGIRQGYVLERR